MDRVVGNRGLLWKLMVCCLVPSACADLTNDPCMEEANETFTSCLDEAEAAYDACVLEYSDIEWRQACLDQWQVGIDLCDSQYDLDVLDC